MNMISGLMDWNPTTLIAVGVSSFGAVLLLLLLVLVLVLKCRRRRQWVPTQEGEVDVEDVDECPVYGIYYYDEGDQVDEGRNEFVDVCEDYETSSIQ